VQIAKSKHRMSLASAANSASNHRMSLASAADSSSNVLLGVQGGVSSRSAAVTLAGVRSDLGPYTPNDPMTEIDHLLDGMKPPSPKERLERLVSMGSFSSEKCVDAAVDVPLPSQPLLDHSESPNADKSALAPAVLEN
jgi:hypothetical protein